MISKVMQALFLILIVLTLLACSKTESGIVNLNEGKIGIIGHGGSGFQSETNPLPHNSFGSIVKAIEANQADGVELDIQISKDLKLILYHDRTLQSMTKCDGCISSKTAMGISACKYRNDYYTNVFTEEHVIELEVIMERFSKRQIKPILFFDIKIFNPCGTDSTDLSEAMAEAINKTILKYDALQWVMVQSVQPYFLDYLKQINGEILLLLEGGNAEEIIETAKIKGYKGVILSNGVISKKEVNQAHSNGLTVVIFDVKTRDGTIEAINKSPDYIQTDNLLLLQQSLK
ncbi:MAG: hypothetical protein H0V01_04155 [Bacteroidetes bacterium]|nr:hypothetical protein [Bacteroidota bacterium]HET6245707.1 glycerophosphodiester phosphodiesterase family protein [Bacteroidia bacterium]